MPRIEGGGIASSHYALVSSGVDRSTCAGVRRRGAAAKRRGEARRLCGLPLARHRRHGPRRLPVLGRLHRTRDGSKLSDNLAIRCLEEARARPEGYKFFGTCVQTDSDGDKLFMTYEGPESGAFGAYDSDQ